MSKPDVVDECSSPIRVLHVDDNPDFRSLAAAFLERVGSFEVYPASTAADGLSRLETTSVDCVVSDFDMPDVDGLAFFEQVSDRYADLPFILFTGKGSEEIAGAAMSAGVTDYVRKRGGREQYEVLANRIQNAVSRSRSAAQSRETAARLRETFERITDAFLSVDDEWQITYANDQAATFLDAPADELVGTDLRTLSSEDGAGFHEEYAEAMRRQEPISFETEALTRPGCWVDIRVYPASDGLSIYWRDITSVRYRERLLGELHEQSRALLSLSSADEICARGVTIAEDVLNVHAACLHQMSTENESNEAPVESLAHGTDPIDEELLSSPAVSALFQAVIDADGPVVVGSDRTPDELPPAAAAVAQPGVYLSTGGERVFVARNGGDGVDDFVVHCLQLLATTIETGLSRVSSDDTLQRERNLLAAFFESSSEPVVRVRFAGDDVRIDRANAAFESVFGVETTAVRGELLGDHVPAPAGLERTHPFGNTTERETPLEAEITRLTEAGPREFLFRSVPFYGTGGTAMAYGIYIDITARKRRERELERYQTIVESTGDPVYTLDADGVITYVNEALEAMTGYDAEELVGQQMSTLVPADGVGRSERLIARLLSDDERTNETIELDVVRADGTSLQCEIHIALLPFDEEFAGTAGAIRDVTERTERERELQAQNDRLDEFANVVSHDLRNPLQIAQGNLEYAQESASEGVESEALASVERALDRIDSIIEDVLTLAREGEEVTDARPVPVAETAHRAWASVETPNADVVVDADPDVTVRADQRRLQRLFENVFRNSVEHATPATGTDDRTDDRTDGGEDGDETPAVTVRVGVSRDDERLTSFFLADDGPGVPPAERERVFEPGYSTADDGTGFGLDIVDSIATAHDWTVTLTESEAGGVRLEFDVSTA